MNQMILLFEVKLCVIMRFNCVTEHDLKDQMANIMILKTLLKITTFPGGTFSQNYHWFIINYKKIHFYYYSQEQSSFVPSNS